MANSLHLSREVKVYVNFGTKYWEIPVLDGFSFSQATNTAEVTLKEMAGASNANRRARKLFTDSLAPAEWSFSTYARPFTRDVLSADEHHAVEEVLWAMMAGADTYSAGAYTRTANPAVVGGAVITPAGSQNTIGFAESNRSTFTTANIYFVLGDASRTVIKLKDAVVNEASIDFEIDGIATINWSGQCSEVLDFTGSTIEANAAGEPNNGDTTQDGTALAAGDVWLQTDSTPKTHRLFVCKNSGAGTEAFTAYVNEAITDSDNFIRNRLTSLTIDGSAQSGLQSSYSLTLTGGNITISNNVSYITPEELGVVNVPIGHVTGARSVSGSFTCYLTRDDSTFDSTR